MGIRIRKAEPEDLELLLQWRMEVLREVFAIPQDQPVDDLREENRRYYQESLESGGHIACFACLDDAIIGCGGICLYQEMPSPDNLTGKCAYLMNIYIRSQFRRQKAGEAVIDWLVAQAAKQGITKIYLETSEAGRRLYQKRGFVPMEDMMKLPNLFCQL